MYENKFDVFMRNYVSGEYQMTLKNAKLAKFKAFLDWTVKKGRNWDYQTLCEFAEHLKAIEYDHATMKKSYAGNSADSYLYCAKEWTETMVLQLKLA
jgi:intergrase/recombinase